MTGFFQKLLLVTNRIKQANFAHVFSNLKGKNIFVLMHTENNSNQKNSKTWALFNLAQILNLYAKILFQRRFFDKTQTNFQQVRNYCDSRIGTVYISRELQLRYCPIERSLYAAFGLASGKREDYILFRE